MKFFFTEIRFQNQKCADIDVEIAMSVLLLLRMIFVSHQQKPLIHTHNSFNSYEEEEKKPKFSNWRFRTLFFYLQSVKKKKRIIPTTFHRFFKNISRLYFRIAKKIMRKKKQNYG